MNRIYRIVFNRALGVPQVVSELDSAPGGTVHATPGTRLKSRLLATAVGLALMTTTASAWAQSCPTSGTITTSCQGTTDSNGGSGADQPGGTPSAAGSGAGGVAGVAGVRGTAGGAGGAFGGNGGWSGMGAGAGGGGGTYGGGGGGSGYGGSSVAGAGGGLPGLVATDSTTINAGVTVAGGSGGYGSEVFTGIGGAGGGGAAGVVFGGTTLNFSNAGTVNGGAGGTGGYGDSAGGGGGGGVALAVMGAGNTLTNSGTLNGGQGGGSGQTPTRDKEGAGGNGGAGLGIVGNSNTFINMGSIQGGNGGPANGLATLGSGGYGVGISGTGNLLINSGSISGGTDSVGNRNDAVFISGTGNTLELLSGYSFTGNVVAVAGNTLALGGLTTNTSFNVNSVSGFDSFNKIDTGTWTLTGSTTAYTPWTVSSGSLRIASDGALGSDISALTLNGGTLALTSSNANVISNRSIVTNNLGGTLGFIGSGSTWTLNGGISGNAALSVSGQGTLIVNSAASNTGLNIGNASTVQVGTGGSTGSIQGPVSVSGGTLVFDRGSSTVFTGDISGTGTLIQSGAGLLALEGNNTFSGNIQVTNGILQIGNGGSSTNSLTGTILDNAQLVLASSSPLSLGSISGTGSLTQSGTGVTTLTADNALTGNVSVDSGTLALTTSGGLSQASSVSVAGTLDISGSSNGASINTLTGVGGLVNLGSQTLTLTNASSTFSGQITGTGGLTVTGGTETLDGLNDYTGTTTIGTGATLSLMNGGKVSQSSQLSDNGQLIVDGLNSSFSLAASPFAGSIGNGSISVRNGASFKSAGDLNIGGNTGEVASVTVSDDSTFQDTRSINVGEFGTGTATVSTGGSFTAQSFISIGDQAGSTGTLVASGAGTLIRASQTLFVGNHQGNGTFTLSDGAAVTSPSIYIANDGGSSGTFNIGADAASAPAAAPVSINSGTVSFGQGTGTLVFNHTDTNFLFNPTILGIGTVKVLAGTTVFTANNVYSSTVIQGGTLQLGNGGTTGSIISNVSNSGTLAFDHSDTVAFAPQISGTGTIVQNGAGTLALNNPNNSSSHISVLSGTLLIGDSANSTALTTGNAEVFNGATLGGTGMLSGNIVVDNGGVLAPGDSGQGTLSVNGDLTMTQGSSFNGVFGAPGSGYSTFGASNSVSVAGNLTLNGVSLNVQTQPGFGKGLYALFSYVGNLTETNGGISLASTTSTDPLSIQQLTAQHQINLLDTGGDVLNFWNANHLASASQMGGGDGTWNTTASIWTTATGDVTAPMTPQPGFAIFGGASGVVTVDNGAGDVSATGMQFASNGYVMQGGDLQLVDDGSGNAPTIRVGDGTANGAAYVAEIDNRLGGSLGLTKTDLGTLILTASNTYTGVTTVDAGTLQIGNGGTSGSVSGDIVDNGNVAFDRSDIVLPGTISGTGSVTQAGSGTLSFGSAQAYTGATHIDNGSLTLTGNGSVATSSVIDDNGAFTIDQANSDQSIVSLSGHGSVYLGSRSLTLTQAADTFSGVVSGNGAVDLAAGNEVLSGANTYTGQTTIEAGATLQLGAGGTTGSIDSDVTANGTLAFDHSDGVNFTHVIDGSGSVTQLGTGSLTLAAQNTYTGGTLISAGNVTGDVQSFGTGAITDNALLTLSQNGNGTFANGISGSGAVLIDGAGAVTFTGTNNYTGGTTVHQGELIGTSGSLQGAMQLDTSAVLGFDQATDGSFGGTISGSGFLLKGNSGTLTLTGDSSQFAGLTGVVGGELDVNGRLGGAVIVQSASTLGGSGEIGGNVTINTGATLAAGGSQTVGTLTVHGNLLLDQGSTVNVDVGAPGSTVGMAGVSDGIQVDGDLTLDDVTLNVNNVGGMGGGLYRLFSYGGNLSESNGGLMLGNVPAGEALQLLDLTGDKQFDLVDTNGLSINMWNGNGQASTSNMGGGSGTWSVNSPNWTDITGQLHTPLAPQPGFAIFGGTAGTITVDNTDGAVVALGLQFASNGYVMKGDTLTLVDNAGAAPIIRVGDGTSQGTGFAAEIDNVIAGNAGLEKTDNGTLVLTGENTYTGGTTISGGTLRIGNGGTTGSILGDVTVYGALSFDRSDATSFAGVISGSGIVVQRGSGTLTLTGANTFTGNAIIDSGTLALTGQGSVANALHVVDNSVFDISQATSGTSIRALGGSGTVLLGNQTLTMTDADSSLPFDGVIAGNGGVTVAGGTQVLAGTNTYTGGTTIQAGTLQIGNGDASGSIAGAVVDNGNLAFDRSDAAVFDGAISGTGSVQQLGTGNLMLTGNNTYTGGTLITAGTLSIGNASAIGTGMLSMAEGTTLNVVDGVTLTNAIGLSGDPDVNVDAGATATLAGVISDGAQAGDLVKTGGGTLVLSGASTYTGGTDVAAGTLDVTGSLASHVTVDGGATLSGTGSVGALDVASGGMVSPAGTDIGSLHVDGNLNLAAGSIYRIDASDTGHSDTVQVGGTATLGGGSVVAIAAGTNWTQDVRYTILSAQGVTGSFGQVSSNFAFLAPTLSYDAGNAYLTLARNDVDFAAVATTPNEAHVAHALGANTDHALYQAVVPLDAASARAAFNAFAGDNVASTRNAILEDSQFVRNTIQDYLLGAKGNVHTTQDGADGSLWVSTWTHGGNQDSDGNAARMRANGSGLLVGVDRSLDAWRVGAVAGTGQLSNSSVDGAGDAHSTDKTVGLYVGADLGPFQYQGGVAHSWYDTRTHRRIGVAGLEGSADANANNGVTQAYIDGGYLLGLGSGSLMPYIDLARAWVHRDAIHEQGSVAALDVQGNSSAVNYGTVGLRGVYEPAAGIQLHVTLGYQHAWGDLRSTDQQRFVGDTTAFTVDGLPLARNTGVADIGMHFMLNSKVSIDASYHGEFASGNKDQGARMALNVSF